MRRLAVLVSLIVGAVGAIAVWLCLGYMALRAVMWAYDTGGTIDQAFTLLMGFGWLMITGFTSVFILEYDEQKEKETQP